MRNPELNAFFAAIEDAWKLRLMEQLRDIFLDCGLTETKKWGAPVYVGRSNVLSMAAFKNHVSMWFFEGVHLTDSAKVLVASAERTKALRKWEFQENSAIDAELIRSYVLEAMENDRKGVRTAPVRNVDLVIPVELTEALEQHLDAKQAFMAMPLSHRREYADHVAEAKREETRKRRAEKCIALIQRSEGLYDRYR